MNPLRRFVLDARELPCRRGPFPDARPFRSADRPSAPLRTIAFVVATTLTCLVTVTIPVRASGSGDPAPPATELADLSLEELMTIEVTSVSKQAEALGKAAAAIHVVTGEEIRNSGARSIAEALRLVPGLQVARTSAHSYALSARGFNGSSADKLQVLIDGRSVYTALTSAVFWDVLDTILPDIDRIEVIRGPGAALWGANAVNGVINIITKSSTETVGGAWTAGGGSEERVFSTLRTGAAVGHAGHARFYLKAFDRDHARLASGAEASDGQRHVQGGLRSDWTLSANQELTVSGDIYSGREDGTGVLSGRPKDTELSGANVLGSWSLRTGETGSLSASMSYDHYERFIPEAFDETRDTYDLGLHHRVALGRNHDVLYGLGFRGSHDRTGGPPLLIIFDPPSRTLNTYSSFAQDRIALAGGAVVLTFGSKFEHNSLTGFEFQPGARLGWEVNAGWFAWGAVSRAVRTPNRIDHDIAIYSPPPGGLPGFPPGLYRIGNRAFDSEKLIAYEWGLRHSRGRTWSAELSTFYNDYRQLRSTERKPPFGNFENQLKGRGTGAEVAVAWKPSAQLDLRSAYSFLDLDFRSRPGSTDTVTARILEGSSARHQAGLQASYRLAQRWMLAGFLRYVGKLPRTATPTVTSGSTHVPGYAELSVRAAYRPWSGLELAVSGENLLAPQHPEFGAMASRTELQRAVLLSSTWLW